MRLTRAPRLPSPCTGDWLACHTQALRPDKGTHTLCHHVTSSIAWQSGRMAMRRVALQNNSLTKITLAKPRAAVYTACWWRYGNMVHSASSSGRVTLGRGYPQQKSLTAQEAAATFILKEKQPGSQRKCQWSSSVKHSGSHLRRNGKIDLRFSVSRPCSYACVFYL